jgi:putative transposase
MSVLNRTFGCIRVVWNRTLAWRHARHHGEQVKTNFTQANAYLTAMNATAELGWLNEVSSVPLQQAIRHQQAAFTSFFAGRNLARYQRRMARCQKGSANRVKARAKVARAHRKVRASRADFLHKASTNLVRDHDLIAIEDLAVKNMVRNRSLAKAISDCGWGTFRRMITYKAERAGRHVILVDRWYPSSKTCSSCGHLLAELTLTTRHWTCPACRTRHERDINAANNILAAGLAVARDTPGDACGADVRRHGTPRPRSAAKQEPHPARAGIPVPQGRE